MYDKLTEENYLQACDKVIVGKATLALADRDLVDSHCMFDCCTNKLQETRGMICVMTFDETRLMSNSVAGNSNFNHFDQSG